MYQELIDTREIDGFTIKTYACEEDISPVGNFASGDDKADKRLTDKIIKKLENGNMSWWFRAKVTAEKEGIELAEDYLGACSYRSFKEFLKPGDYHSDMVATVIEEAKTKIKALSA